MPSLSPLPENCQQPMECVVPDSSLLTLLPTLPTVDQNLPILCGWDTEIQQATCSNQPVFLPYSTLDLDQVSATFAIALHMHQPMIPAGTEGELISHLQYMFEHPYDGDNHNAGAYTYCYSRIADFVIDLVQQGCQPRVMLDYSGCLLWGLHQMGRTDILTNLRRVTCDPSYQPYVEWLGTFWSHAIAPSIPLLDLKLQVRAWQHHFASVFGWEALSRVKGFSLPELRLPNHPDALYELVRVLKECGYHWLLVSAQSVETLTGDPIADPHLPYQLVARNAEGDRQSITVLLKTQPIDHQLVARMQPYTEAKTLSSVTLSDQRPLPPLVTQIGDGENSGAMMNEFPSHFRNAWYDLRYPQADAPNVAGVTGTEYLELLVANGHDPTQYPTCQARGQAQLWQQIGTNANNPDALASAIAQLRETQPEQSIEGSSWTTHISWVRGYDNTDTPANQLSALFHRTVDPLQSTSANESEPLTQQFRYRNALMHTLLLQTSCFGAWGVEPWSDYEQELYRRGEAILKSDF